MPGMRLTVDGETYDYNGKLMLPEAAAIQTATGLTYGEWQQQVNKGDIVALAALLWVLKKRAGQIMPFADLDFDVNALETTFLREDGTAVDMNEVAARAEQLVKTGLDREDALRQAMTEAMEVKPAAAAEEPGNPTAGAGTAQPAPPLTPPLPPPSSVTSPSSPTTSASPLGTSTG